MGNLKNNLILFTILTGASLTIYLLQFVLFKDLSNTIFYFFQDMAFVPIQALIATLLVNKFISMTELQRKKKKINVVISTFFVETGVEIMTAMSGFDQNHRQACEIVKVKELINNKGSAIKKAVTGFEFDFYADPEKLDELAAIMDQNRSFLLKLLENQNLFEHETFTDMLWAVFHLADELKTRGDLRKITKEEVKHISDDMLRAYRALTLEWIGYINYLKVEYPFLFTIAIRKNPFYSKA